jgi:hypothetical protein
MCLGLAGVPPALAATPSTRLVSRADGPDGRLANGGGYAIDVSADGRYVLFGSTDAHLTATPGLGGGSDFDIYMRDTVLGRTELISRETGAAGAPIDGCNSSGMSADARLVVLACRLGRVLVRDRTLQTTTTVTSALPFADFIGKPTADGHYAIVRGSGGFNTDTAVVDLTNGSTVYHARYSGTDGARAERLSSPGVLSPGGRYALFDSPIPDLEVPHATAPDDPPTGPDKVYVRDLQTSQTVLVSRGDGAAGAASTTNANGVEVSDDGHALFGNFQQSAELPPGAMGRHLIRDIANGRTEAAERNSAGEVANGEVGYAHLSPDGRYLIFESKATNLDGCVDNRYPSVYIRI